MPDPGGGRDNRGALRVAVVLDRTVVPSWVATVVADVNESTAAGVVIRVVAPDSARLPSRRPLLWSVYERLDRAAFRPKKDAFAPVDVTSELQQFADRSDAALAGSDLDVVLWLAGGRPSAAVRASARFGVWGFHQGEPSARGDEDSFSAELLDGRSVGAIGLHVFGDEPAADRAIYRSYSAVDPHSLYRTRNRAYWKAAHFPRRRLEQVHRFGRRVLQYETTRSPPREPRKPSELGTLFFCARLVARLARSKVRNALYEEAWFLAFRRVSRRAARGDDEPWTVVAPPRGRSFADPSLIGARNRHFVFFEDYLSRERRGVISFVEIEPDARVSAPRVVLERSHHLSYPFVFTHRDEIFLVPETAASRTIELYRAVDFPRGWVHERTLLDNLSGVDATVVPHAGKLWLFANVKEDGAAYSEELSIFYADALDGAWTPHALNPVVSDVRSARPAGRIFERDGLLIRPGQDSSTRYGSAVVLHRIDALSPDDYHETAIARIDGSWRKGNRGTHTYDCDGHFEIVDGREWRPRLRRGG